MLSAMSVYLPGCLSCMAKGFVGIGHYLEVPQPDSFISVVFTGTIDLYCFIPLLMALTLAEDHNVS